MRKLVQGIVEFRRSRRPDYVETFSRLALRLAAGRENVRWPHLRSWLRHGEAAAEVHAWDPGLGRFRPIDDHHAAQILQRIRR